MTQSPLIGQFLFDEENIEKLAGHGLNPIQVSQVLLNPYTRLPNRRGRRAPYVIIGTDNGGMCLAIPVEATTFPAVWRPVTAWRCKESERQKLPVRR